MSYSAVKSLKYSALKVISAYIYNDKGISIDILSVIKYILPMKKLTTVLLLIFLVISVAFAGALLDYFHAQSEADNVKLEWKTTTESNLANFIIERKTPDSDFIELATVAPKGNNSVYTYLDQAAYKMTNPVFVYRLKILDLDGSVSYSSTVSVSPNISGVKRTWGSIKAMFR